VEKGIRRCGDDGGEAETASLNAHAHDEVEGWGLLDDDDAGWASHVDVVEGLGEGDGQGGD
jgi:hypothetical protein